MGWKTRSITAAGGQAERISPLLAVSGGERSPGWRESCARWARVVLPASLGLLAIDAPASPMQAHPGLERCAAYRPLTPDQLRSATALFSRMLDGTAQDDDRLRKQWSALGFELSEFSPGARGWWQLREPAADCRGQGYFLVRGQQPVHSVLQIPHAYADLHTGEIALRMLDGPFDLIAWNTVRRDTLSEDDGKPADLARRDDSLLTALTESLARGTASVRIVQLHGFSSKRRKTREGADAAAIVSGGSRWVTPAADAVARCLEGFIEGNVRVFPRDVSELGATTNLHGAILRRHGHQGFVHVELNLATRRRLLEDAVWRQRFSACLAQEDAE